MAKVKNNKNIFIRDSRRIKSRIKSYVKHFMYLNCWLLIIQKDFENVVEAEKSTKHCLVTLASRDYVGYSNTKS